MNPMHEADCGRIAGEWLARHGPCRGRAPAGYRLASRPGAAPGDIRPSRSNMAGHPHRRARLTGDWELILSCQVLEHISEPATHLRKVSALLVDSGWLYIEVPAEHRRPAARR